MNKLKFFSYWVGLFGVVALGVFYRTNVYCQHSVFNDDECRLAICILSKTFFQSLFVLGDAQSAPPIFVLLSKFLFTIFGFKEQAAKFIPYLASLGAIFFFYKNLMVFFKNKIIIIFSMFLFCISRYMIEFSCIFKQYSLDVFTCLVCLYYFPKVKINDLNNKNCVILSIALCLLPLISLPSLFFIGTLFIQNIFDNIKNKQGLLKILKIFIPFIIIMVFYYLFNLSSSKADLDYYFPDYWKEGFCSLSLSSIVRLLACNLKTYLFPNAMTLPALILFVVGVFFLLKEKRRESNFVLMVLCLVLLASCLHLYPFIFRVGLYMTPIFLFIIAKPLECKNKLGFIVITFLMFFSVYKYNYSYFTDLCKIETFFTHSPKYLMNIMKDKFDSDSDVVLCNEASASSYIYYSSVLQFNNDKRYTMLLESKNKKKSFEYLNNLPNGQKIWFYLIKDYSKNKVFPILFEWLETQKILYSIQDGNSYLFYIEKK